MGEPVCAATSVVAELVGARRCSQRRPGAGSKNKRQRATMASRWLATAGSGERVVGDAANAATGVLAGLVHRRCCAQRWREGGIQQGRWRAFQVTGQVVTAGESGGDDVAPTCDGSAVAAALVRARRRFRQRRWWTSTTSDCTRLTQRRGLRAQGGQWDRWAEGVERWWEGARWAWRLSLPSTTYNVEHAH